MLIPILLAGGVIAYIWTKRDTRIAGPTTGRLPPRTGQLTTITEDVPVPFGQYAANGILRERITARQAGNIHAAPNEQSNVVGDFAAGSTLITPNVDDTRNFGGPLRPSDPGYGTPGWSDPGWFPVEVSTRPTGGWARLILFDFDSREPAQTPVGRTTSTDPAVARLESAIQGGQSAKIIRNLRSQVDPRLVERYRPVVIDRQKLFGGLFIPDRVLPRRYIYAWTIGPQGPMSPTDTRLGVPIVRYFDSHTFSLDKAPTDVVRYFNAGIRPEIEFVPVDTIIAGPVPFPEPVRISAGGGRRVPTTAGIVGQTADRSRFFCNIEVGCPLRGGLGETASSVGTVAFGEEVEVVRRAGPFAYVDYPKGLFSGWVSSSTLREERVTKSTLASCVHASCPIRLFRAGSEYVYYGSLKRGERVTIHESPPAGRAVPAGRLYFTKADGTEGYVESRYVRPLAGVRTGQIR